MNIATALLHCRPTAKFAVAETYESIVWYDTEQEKPTLSELEAAWADFMQAREAAKQATDDLAQRRAQMADLLDALPIDTQAALWATRVAVEQALDRGLIPIARQIVVAAVIPAELEPIREAILEKFPSLP